jgi:hypothetical protein
MDAALVPPVAPVPMLFDTLFPPLAKMVDVVPNHESPPALLDVVGVPCPTFTV